MQVTDSKLRKKNNLKLILTQAEKGNVMQQSPNFFQIFMKLSL